MGTTMERLLDAAKDVWMQYNKHPFVLGLQNGTLDREKFRYYIIQDFLYLKDYVKVFALGIAKAKSVETTRLFSNYITLLTGSEMDIHRGYMGKFAITQEELDTTPRALNSLSYTSFMLRVAYEEEEAEILTAILACAYSYEGIVKKMLENNPSAADHEFYGEWVKGYLSPEYAERNVILLRAVENLTKNYTEAQLKHLTDIFTACSRFELAFWDMGWEMKK